MGLLSRFLASDPTAGWPEAGVRPALDIAERRVGPLRLGDPFESARAVGKPRRVKRSGASCTLEYDGYRLEFAGDRLVCATYDLDGTDRVQVGEHELSARTAPLDVQVWFGDASSDSPGPGGIRWMDYERPGATLALEFGGDALVCVQLYAEGYA